MRRSRSIAPAALATLLAAMGLLPSLPGAVQGKENPVAAVSAANARHQFTENAGGPDRFDLAYLSPKKSSVPASIRIKSRAGGGNRFRLSEIGNLENAIPDKEQCEVIGKKFGEQLRGAGGEGVRFWVRMGRGDIGYCQRDFSQWFVEYFDRSIQDALVVELVY